MRDFAFCLFLVHSMVAEQSQFSFSWISRHIIIDKTILVFLQNNIILPPPQKACVLTGSWLFFVHSLQGIRMPFLILETSCYMFFDFAARYLIDCHISKVWYFFLYHLDINPDMKIEQILVYWLFISTLQNCPIIEQVSVKNK